MINIKMQPTEVQKLSPKIAVIGVGGAGGNAVNNMIASNLDGCEFLVCNTDAQALNSSLAENTVQLGASVTGGLGAGSKPEIGQAAAEESLEEVLRYLDGANMAFVTCGMGGGTGTGAAPVIAKACRQQGVLTVGVVTKPFHFEGAHRMEQAEAGIKEMQQYVDTLIVIPNQNLFRVADEKTTFAEGFKMADTVLQSGVRGVTDLMVRPGIVNLDFADIRTAMLQMGKAMMGTGEASGDKRAVEAAEAAINNPLLDDVSMKGANGVIINVTGGYDMTLFEVDEACNRIRDEVDPSANIIFGTTFDDSLDGFMRVSIVATGIEVQESKKVGASGGTGTGNNSPYGGGRKQPSNSANVKTGSAMPASSGVSSVSSPVPSAVTAVASSVEDGRSSKKSSVFMSGRDVVKGLTAPSQAPAAQISSSVDMFEQGEFADVGADSAPRGSRYNDSFIPPKPMEPDMPIAENGIGSYISSFHGSHVDAKKDDINEPVSSMRLNPPKVSAPTSKPAHMPTLLERITGSMQQRIDSLLDDGEAVKEESSSSMQSKATSSPITPSQGSLDISTPSGKPAVKLDDELDIPAFLRRQAN